MTSWKKRKLNNWKSELETASHLPLYLTPSFSIASTSPTSSSYDLPPNPLPPSSPVVCSSLTASPLPFSATAPSSSSSSTSPYSTSPHHFSSSRSVVDSLDYDDEEGEEWREAGKSRPGAGEEGGGGERSRKHVNKDVTLAREQGIVEHISVDDIINLPMDEFNDRLAKSIMTQEQQEVSRDIRRRGKNKIAAQNCRKRKYEDLETKEKQASRMRQELLYLNRKEDELTKILERELSYMNRLEEEVLRVLDLDPKFWKVKLDLEKKEVTFDKLNPSPTHLTSILASSSSSSSTHCYPPPHVNSRVSLTLPPSGPQFNSVSNFLGGGERPEPPLSHSSTPHAFARINTASPVISDVYGSLQHKDPDREISQGCCQNSQAATETIYQWGPGQTGLALERGLDGMVTPAGCGASFPMSHNLSFLKCHAPIYYTNTPVDYSLSRKQTILPLR